MSKEGQPVGWPEKEFPERPGLAKWRKVVTESSHSAAFGGTQVWTAQLDSSPGVIWSLLHSILTRIYAEPFPALHGKFWNKDDLMISLVSTNLREELSWLMQLNSNQKGRGILPSLKWLGDISGHL